MRRVFVRFVREDEGQDLIEYAFLAIFVGLVVTIALGTLGTNLNTKFDAIGTQISSGS